MEDRMITVPLEEYISLIKIKARTEILESITKKSKYDIEPSEIARVIGFELEGDK